MKQVCITKNNLRTIFNHWFDKQQIYFQEILLTDTNCFRFTSVCLQAPCILLVWCQHKQILVFWVREAIRTEKQLSWRHCPYGGRGAQWAAILCLLFLAENTNFVTSALRGDLSTMNVRPWCGHQICSMNQWIGNSILPQFDPKKSSLAQIEAQRSSPL